MTRRMTTDEFIAGAKAVHGEIYDYIKSIYTKSNEKLVISCLKHGDFQQSPNSHLRGSGCRICGLETKISGRRKTLDQFIADAKEAHGEIYTYENVEYKNSKVKVCITCEEHGDFWIAPDCFLSGQRCYKCALTARGMSRRNTFNDFVALAREEHGEKFYYVEESYTDSSTKMTIVCPDHGEFEQTPRSHSYGRGCAGCSRSGFNPVNPAHVYCLKSEDSAFLKVGITGSMSKRMASLKSSTPFNFNVIGSIEVDGTMAREIERGVHFRFLSAGLSGFDGCTEWLRYDEEIISMFV